MFSQSHVSSASQFFISLVFHKVPDVFIGWQILREASVYQPCFYDSYRLKRMQSYLHVFLQSMFIINGAFKLPWPYASIMVPVNNVLLVRI